MASSSASSIQQTNFKYDVFLSFRGEDTRSTFVGHLYDALKRESIETYKDDENLERGKKISKELIQAIHDSRFHVIVFSKNYASSSWCLDELVKIMECQKMQAGGQTVYPIFYHVEPTEVRKLSGEFGKAFAKHENAEAAEKWREALVEATSFSGQELTADRQEVEFIKRVVKEISLKLPSIGAVDDNLIGMRTRIKGVVSSLNTFPDEFCMIGIWGMGGIGKTTLARAVFDQISNQFEGSSFVENVRESSILGLSSLQQQVLRDVLNKQDIIVTGVFDGKTKMKKYMSTRKVLVVLDDVDNIDQLKALSGEPNWFMKGSKIIITTRDKQVLVAHKVVNSIQEVNPLTDEEAISLLSRCAFGKKESPFQGYEKLSRQVVSYAAGLPLTITTLGAALCDENEQVWKDTLKELEKIPLDGTLQRLELSYKGLDHNCQEIFLDVVCILKGWKEDEAIKVLESCGFPAKRGLSVLEKRSLITISHDKYLGMHDRIEEMGRHVVRQLHPDDPSQHSRLWIKKEIMDILENNQGTKATKCIKLISTLSSDIKPKTIMKGLGNMGNLRFLLVRSFDFSRPELDETSHFPNSLQYLEWYRYPFRSLPRSFQASNLVVLKMSNTHIEQLWEGGERKVLHKLQFLQFAAPKLRNFDFGLTPNLEMLDLERCYDLKELDTLVGCRKLKSLKLNRLKLSILDLLLTPNIDTLNLNEFVDLVELVCPRKCPQLKTLSLKGCSSLVKLDMPWECPQLITVNLVGCRGLVELHMPWEWPQLQTLNLEECIGLEKLVMPEKCPQLITVNLVRCSSLVKLDMPMECPQLRTLDVGYGYALSELHMPHKCPQLETLCLWECGKLEKLDMPRECPQLKTLDVGYGYALSELYMPHKCPQLETLCLWECSKLENLDMPKECPQLKTLNVWHGYVLSELHMPHQCPQLETLHLTGCNELEKLDMPREYPQLKSLRIGGQKLRLLINQVESMDFDDLVLPELQHLRLAHSKSRTFKLGLNLKSLDLESCDLEELHIPDGDVKLQDLEIRTCKNLKTLDLTQTLNLINLKLIACDNLVKLHTPVGGLQKLINLKTFWLNLSKIVDVDGRKSPLIDMSEMLVDLGRL